MDRLLTSGPARWLGDRSYALYLWHWPMLMLVVATTGEAFVDAPTGLAIVAAAVLAAALTHRFVEVPAGRVGGLRISVVATVVVVAATTAWQVAAVVADQPLPRCARPGRGRLRSRRPGCRRRSRCRRLGADRALGLRAVARFPMDACTRPRPEPAERQRADRRGRRLARPAAVGGAGADRRRRNWELTVIVRGACPFSTVPEVDPDDTDCAAWLAAAYDEIVAMRPDVVVTTATRNVRVGPTEHTPAGFVEQWQRLAAGGDPGAGAARHPRFDESMPDCLARNAADPAACGADRAQLYTAEPPWARVEGVPPTVAFLDLADAVCTTDRCPAVIGNVLVYLDDNHLTATYAATMAPLLEERVRAALGTPA